MKSERGTLIAKGYVDDISSMLLALLLGVVIISSGMHSCQYIKIRNLERRVAELEQKK
jgi:uncharacterized membrane protein YqgA involved in biofilm formation